MLVEDRRCGEDEAADGGMDDGFDQENMVLKLLFVMCVVRIRVFWWLLSLVGTLADKS